MIRNNSFQSTRRWLGVGFATLMSLTATIGHATPTVDDLLTYGPPEDLSGPMAATAAFLQSSGNATSIQKITLNYFTSTDCSGAAAGTYTTPDGTSFPINTSTTFGLNAASTYRVGYNLFLTMTAMHSVAIFLKSQNTNTPQANFTGSTCGTNPSFCCVQIDCSNGAECTQSSAIGTQNFALKNTAAVGDPADGGVIGCMSGGLNNLVVPAADNSTSIVWSASSSTTNATSTTDGAANTATIVAALSPGQAVGSYAAGLCSTYTTTGGFTTGWFLSAKDQLNCLYGNKAAVGGFANDFYWSSTEADADKAWAQNFDNGDQLFDFKVFNGRVRCARAFTP